MSKFRDLQSIKKTHEKEEYKKYAPLTKAQEKEMTDDEIEKWNKKSKTGLLGNDKTDDVLNIINEAKNFVKLNSSKNNTSVCFKLSIITSFLESPILDLINLNVYFKLISNLSSLLLLDVY